MDRCMCRPGVSGGGGASAAVGSWRVGHRRRRARRQVCAGRRDACGGRAGDRNISAPRCVRGRARAGGAVCARGIDYFRCGGGRIGHRNVSARRRERRRAGDGGVVRARRASARWRWRRCTCRRIDNLRRRGGRPGDGIYAPAAASVGALAPAAVCASRIGRRRGRAPHAISAGRIHEVSSSAGLVVVSRRGAIRIERHDFPSVVYAQQIRSGQPFSARSNFKETAANDAFCATPHQSMAPPFFIAILKNAPRCCDRRHSSASSAFAPPDSNPHDFGRP